MKNVLLLLLLAMTKTRLTLTMECYKAGMCHGRLLGVDVDTNGVVSGCRKSCKETPGCGWYSASEVDGYCGLMTSCQSFIIETCLTCSSGE
jgi:hypothetical protein